MFTVERGEESRGVLPVTAGESYRTIGTGRGGEARLQTWHDKSLAQDLKDLLAGEGRSAHFYRMKELMTS